MTIVVNGAPREVDADVSLAALVDDLTGGQQTAVAVARNGEVVLRSRWQDTRLAPHDRIEVLHAVQGG
ncbi:MAG: sulfur carrier protein ThiS [Candidatus Dormibacteria bacterium]